MKNIIIFFFLLTFVSCVKKNVIYYEYNGVTITRIDKDNKIYFYYGNYNEKDITPLSYIKASYHGFDGEMGSYVNFLPNNKVEMIIIDGYFDKIGNDSLFTLRKLKPTEYFIENIEGKYNNVIRVSEVIDFEKKLNIENYSKVKAIYPNKN